MKLLNTNKQIPEEQTEAETMINSANTKRTPTKRVIHHPITIRHSFSKLNKETASKTEEAINPGEKLRAFEAAAKTAKPMKLPAKYRLRPDPQKTRYAFWDIAGVLSLICNAILLGILLVMAWQIKTLKQAVGTGLLGGLYGNFVDMDSASITTTITVSTQIPLNFNLPVQANTDVTLTRDVNIPGAHVIINTPLFNINAPANVTLPLGTHLPIAIDINLPVQTNIPVSLQVPVNIPLSSTGLHDPFTGLQNAIRPYYCMLEPNAQYPPGTYICKQTDVFSPAPGAP